MPKRMWVKRDGTFGEAIRPDIPRNLCIKDRRSNATDKLDAVFASLLRKSNERYQRKNKICAAEVNVQPKMIC